MGDILGIADSAGNLIASYAYDPWGKVLSITGSDIAIGNLNPFRYRGYYYDAETGLYYLQSRYYDPEVGRFINCDDVNYIGTTGSEISYNPFAYCKNDPVNNYDPNGYGPVLIATLIGLAIGGIGGAVASYICKGKVKITWIVGGMTLGALAGAGLGWLYTTFKGAAASWSAYKAAQISSGATISSSSIGSMFEKWYYGFNKIGKGLQQVTKSINGKTFRFDAIKSGKIIELKNYDWSKYRSYKSIINSFTNQANNYKQFIGQTIHGQKITGVKFYFSSKPPQEIINALKKIGVAVSWVK